MNDRPLKVGDVMQQDFIALDGMATVAEALSKLNTHDCQALIIRKRHADDEHGIVLLTDIVSAVLAENRAPERVNVYEIMTKPVVTVRPGMSVKNCARMFAHLGISTAPVLRDNEIVGIVSYRELAFGSFR